MWVYSHAEGHVSHPAGVIFGQYRIMSFNIFQCLEPIIDIYIQ